MAVRTNFHPSKENQPSTILLGDMRQLHNEMADLILLFNGICERLEKCAASIKNMNMLNNREMFQQFFDRGIAPGKLVRFVDTQNKNTIYEVTGIDGEGFFLQKFPNGQEFKLRVLEDNYRCKAMRIIKETSYLVKKALREHNLQEDALPSQRKKARLTSNNLDIEEESYFDVAMFDEDTEQQIKELQEESNHDMQ